MSSGAESPLLSVRGLTCEVRLGDRWTPLLEGVDLVVERGRTLALVGESGSGKSMTAFAVMGLLPPAVRVAAGEIELDGRALGSRGAGSVAGLRGRRVAMVFQEAISSLNPLLPIGRQIGEVLEVHHGLRGRAQRNRVVELLSQVGIPDAEQRAAAYPHQFSGGMRQRALIACALAGEPDLLIADEPTTALDVTVQAQVLELLARLQRERGLGLLLITHDLGVVAQFAHRAAVMYAGRIVETGPAGDLLNSPRHPYTAGLLESIPRMDDELDRRSGEALPVIRGEPPRAGARPKGCAFHPRCSSADGQRCSSEAPTLTGVGGDRFAACWHPCYPTGT